jgi:hypothetical protein
MAVGWPGTGLKLEAEEALNWAGKHHIEEEQAFLDLASVVAADSPQQERRDFEIGMVVEERRDSRMELLL